MHPVHVFPVSPFVWKPVVLHSPQTGRRRAQARRMHVVSPSCALTRRVVLNTVLGVVITGEFQTSHKCPGKFVSFTKIHAHIQLDFRGAQLCLFIHA